MLPNLWLAPRKGSGFDNFRPKEKTKKKIFDKSKDNDEKKSRWDSDEANNKNNGNFPSGNPIFYLISFLLLFNLVQYVFSSDETQNGNIPEIEQGFASREITWNDLIHHLLRSSNSNENQVEKIVVLDRTTAQVILKPGAPGLNSSRQNSSAFETNGYSAPPLSSPSPNRLPRLMYRLAIGSVDTFERKMDEAQRSLGIPPEKHVPIQYTADSTLTSELFTVVPSLFVITVMFLFFQGVASRMSGGGGRAGGMGGIFQVGKSTAKKTSKEDVTTTFADVAGCQEAKKEIMEFVDFLQEPTRFTRLGAKIPKGALL